MWLRMQSQFYLFGSAQTTMQAQTIVEQDVCLVEEGVLRDRALEVLAMGEDCVDPRLPPLVPLMCNQLLQRIYNIVWKLPAKSLNGWSKQCALGKVVAAVCGGKIPSLRSDAERPGQRMHEFLTRYEEKWKVASKSEKAALRRWKAAHGSDPEQAVVEELSATRTRLALEQQPYHCRYGCTPVTLPVRSVPPGMRPQKVEYESCHLADLNLLLQKENKVLQAMESEAVKVLEHKLSHQRMECSNAVASEHVALCLLEDERKVLCKIQKDIEQLRQEKESMQRCARDAEICMHDMNAQLAVLNLELVCAENRMQELNTEGALLYTKCTAQEEELGELRREHEKEKLKAEGLLLRLGAQIATLHVEAGRQKDIHEKTMKKLNMKNEQLGSLLQEEKEKSQHMRELKNKMAEKKRAAEGRADTSCKRLARAKNAEESLKELQAENEELHESMEVAVSNAESSSANFVPERSSGRFGAFPWSIRLLIYKWLLRRTPPSAIGPNMVDAIQLLRPDMPLSDIRVPDISMVRRMRQEATLLGECVSAYRIATCKRVVSFGFDETTKMGDGLTSVNFQIESSNGEICDEVLRGAFLIPGGAADQVAQAMESKVFTRERRLLQCWREEHERKFGADSWKGPKASQLGYHRLVNSLIMSDTCNAARAAKRRIIEMASEEAEKIARAAGLWEDMSELEQRKATTIYVGDCMQHIRNILLDAMSTAACSMLKDELQESLEAFSSFERMSTDPMQLIRAAYKEFHHEGEYAKGKGKEFEHWRRTRHGCAFFIAFERARGGRQDLAFDGAVPLFANRVLACTYLREQVFTPGHANILEDFLWHTLSCIEMVALLRVLTLFDLLLSRPLRWLCGSASQLSNWSIYDFGPKVLDVVEVLLEKIAADGEVLLDPTLDPFAHLADTQPLFKKWRSELQTEKARSPNGQSTFDWYVCLLGEARTPQNSSNAEATDMTVQLAMHMAAEGLKKMRDPRVSIHDWLQSANGQFSVANVTDEARMATVGAHSTNDRVESNFGGYDSVVRMFRTISVDAASGIAQQMRMHHFDSRVDFVAHDRRRSKKDPDEADERDAGRGFFERELSVQMQESAIEMVRKQRDCAREWERRDRQEQNEYREMRRTQNLQLQLDALAEKGAIIIERFDAYEHRAAISWSAVQRALDSMHSSAAQVAYLREQIELRVLGLGWSGLAIPWQKGDESTAQSISRLSAHLRERLLPHEAKVKQEGLIPTEAPMPDFKAKTIKQLGKATSDSCQLANLALCSPEQMNAAIQRERDRRAAAGFADAVQALQPKEPPELDDNLHGKKLEICWNYISNRGSQDKDSDMVSL